jgi:WD40 repeat protein
MAEGRILSWSRYDKTLRLWDMAGIALAVFEGHTDLVNGALGLPDGRILSWSQDKTLRLWDCNGKARAVLEGHTAWIEGALALPDGRILSWSGDWTPGGLEKDPFWGDKTVRLWDKNGKPLEVYGLDEGLQLFPEGKREFYGPNRVSGNAYLFDKYNSAILGRHKPAIFWHGASECTAHLLEADGRAVVTQANGQVCFLQLCHGNRPITLDELETSVTAEAGSHHTAEPPGESTPEP